MVNVLRMEFFFLRWHDVTLFDKQDKQYTDEIHNRDMEVHTPYLTW